MDFLLETSGLGINLAPNSPPTLLSDGPGDVYMDIRILSRIYMLRFITLHILSSQMVQKMSTWILGYCLGYIC
jgi:hypothetical protein